MAIYKGKYTPLELGTKPFPNPVGTISDTIMVPTDRSWGSNIDNDTPFLMDADNVYLKKQQKDKGSPWVNTNQNE